MAIPDNYSVIIDGRELVLPVVPLRGAPIHIALFDSLGDWRLCDFLVGAMLRHAAERGVDLGGVEAILTAGKAVTLGGALARAMGLESLSVAEKIEKNFWQDSFSARSHSITGGQDECLVVGGRRADMLRGRRVLVLDDVISTGRSIRALAKIARHYGTLVAVMAPFVEDQGALPETVEGAPAITLASLPVWAGGA